MKKIFNLFKNDLHILEGAHLSADTSLATQKFKKKPQCSIKTELNEIIIFWATLHFFGCKLFFSGNCNEKLAQALKPTVIQVKLVPIPATLCRPF